MLPTGLDGGSGSKRHWNSQVCHSQARWTRNSSSRNCSTELMGHSTLQLGFLITALPACSCGSAAAATSNRPICCVAAVGRGMRSSLHTVSDCFGRQASASRRLLAFPSAQSYSYGPQGHRKGILRPNEDMHALLGWACMACLAV